MGNEINIHGEFWVIDGEIKFVDGDVSDATHEMVAVEHVFLKYSDDVSKLCKLYKIETDSFQGHDGIDTEAIGNALSSVQEYLTTGIRDDGEQTEPDIRPISQDQANQLIMSELDCNEEALEILMGGDDGRLYCMVYEGWIAIRNHNIELYGFDNQKRAEVAEAIANIIYEENNISEDEYDPNEVEVYIFDHKTGRSFHTNLFELFAPIQSIKLGDKGPATAVPPKDQYLKWNPHDTQENTPKWGNKPPPKNPDKWTQSYRNKQLGFHPPWKGTSESVGIFFEWMKRLPLNESETTEEDFQRKLDANPNDWQTRLVFADWLQEKDDPRAEGYRAMGMLRVMPHLDAPGFCAPTTASKYNEHRPHALPQKWFDLIPYGYKPHNKWWKQFKTRREAEDVAAIAFAKLPPSRRQEIISKGV